MNENINIFSIAKNVKTLGPGNRIVIWVQGCPFNCKGCISPEGIPMEINTLVSIEQLAKEIINDKTITGITFSGGEPFLQASKLTKLIEVLKSNMLELDYICFTGYKYKDLVWEEAKEFLTHLDLLIDGKYIERLNNNLGLRGSTNQQIHFLTEKFIPLKEEFLGQSRSVIIKVGNKQIQSIGIPNKQIKV